MHYSCLTTVTHVMNSTTARRCVAKEAQGEAGGGGGGGGEDLAVKHAASSFAM